MLSGLGTEEKIEALSLCYSESPWDYNSKHIGGGNTRFINVCGVNPYHWADHLKEQNIKVNSILAGYEVYRYYLGKTKSPVLALKEFKGIESKRKMWIVYKVRRVTEEVKRQNKDIIRNKNAM